jgi:hypothetical protein
MNTEALPCPFCGGAGIVKDYYMSQGKGETTWYWYVECENGGDCPCGPVTWHVSTRDEAIAKWNTRHSVNPHLSRYEDIG